MATLDMLRPGLLTDVNAETNKAVDTGIKLATMQDEIQQQKQAVEKQKLDIEAAKFGQALSTMKTFSSMDPKVQGMSAKYLGQKLADYGFANGPMLLDTLKSDDTSKFMMNNIASASPEELQGIGIDPQSGVQGIMAMTDPMAFRTSIQDINDRLIKYREGSRTERIADKRIAMQEASADKRLAAADARAEKAAERADIKQEKKDKQQLVKQEDDLRNSYLKQDTYKRMSEISSAFQAVDDIDASGGATGAGQQALIYAFNKILDPGSVVRETEYATAAKNAGKLSQAQMYLENLRSGKSLTPAQVKEMKEVAKGLRDSARKLLGSTQTEYRRLADSKGLNADNIIIDPFKGSEEKKKETPTFTPPAHWSPEMTAKYKASRGIQ